MRTDPQKAHVIGSAQEARASRPCHFPEDVAQASCLCLASFAWAGCPCHSKSRSGFSLIELLVVIAIIAVMATMVAPTLGALQGNAVTRGGDLVTQTLSRARERAVTLNRRVQVRFYKYLPADEPGSEASYRALQLFEVDDLGNAKPIDKVQTLPPGVLMNANPSVSPLFSLSNFVFTNTIPEAGISYTAVSFHFRPNGSTDLLDLLATAESVVTLHRANAGASPAQPPANFYSIEIDPISAAIRTHRP